MVRTTRRVAALKALWDVLRGSRSADAPSVRERVRALPRMVVQGLTGRYPHLAKGRLGLAAIAMAYVLSPLNLIPEMLLPLLGLGDDALVVAWFAGTVLSETDAFLRWEREQSRTVVGEVVG
jgi:uncharacterized membrane protein YkvA (DUF1232 family)